MIGFILVRVCFWQFIFYEFKETNNASTKEQTQVTSKNSNEIFSSVDIHLLFNIDL